MRRYEPATAADIRQRAEYQAFAVSLFKEWQVAVSALLGFVLIALWRAGGGKFSGPSVLFVALAALLFACFRVWQREHRQIAERDAKIQELTDRLNPKQALEFSCGPDVEGSVVDPVDKQEYVDREGRHFHKGRWFRVVVRARSENPIKNCRARLVRVRGSSVNRSFDADPLTWAPGTHANPPREIRVSPSEAFDVIWVSQFGRLLFGTPGLQWNYEKANELFPVPGDYQIMVVVTGDSIAPHELTLNFQWSGTWDSTLRLSAVSATSPSGNRPNIP